jgi:hypothetical protein
LHERWLNPAFVKMIQTIGFDKNHIRGEGAWLFDAAAPSEGESGSRPDCSRSQDLFQRFWN